MTDFLRSLYNIPDNQDSLPDYILIWNKKVGSKWIKSITEAYEYAKRIKNDVYFQVALSHQDYGKFHRNSADESKSKPVSFIPALFADIDIKADSSNGKKYPNSIEECEQIWNIPNFLPTIVNHSGNGIHAFWCFDEPIALDNKQKRLDMIEILGRFKYMLQRHAASFGFNIDAVQDLVRILRMPGTFNTKNNESKECKTLFISPIRYSLGQVIEFLPAQMALVPSPQQQRQYKEDDVVEGEIVDEEMKRLIFDPRAMPPQQKLEILMVNDSDFTLLYNHHPIHNMGDKSDSGFDFQLAKAAFHALWTMQEVANLLIAFRRKHSKNIAKALRQDYMYATLSKARNEAKKELSYDFVDNAVTNKGTEYDVNVETNEESKLKAKQSLSNLHNLPPIREILCFRNDNDDARYEIITDNGTIFIPTSHDLLTPTKLKIHVARDIKVVMRYDKKTWDKSAQLILDITVEAEQSDQSLLVTSMPGLLDELFRIAVTATSVEDVISQRMPFRYKGHNVFFLDRFIEFIRMQYNTNTLGRDKILRALHDSGCYTKSVRINGQTYQLWFVPQEIFDKHHKKATFSL